MKPSSHEYKTMGLAAYSKFNYYKNLLNKFKKIQIIKNYKFKFVNKPKDTFFAIKKIIEGERFDSVAGALQKFTEEIIISWIYKLSKKHKIPNICFTGGVAMNVKVNMLITEIPHIKKFYVPPTPDDTSQCIGACFAAYLENKNQFHLKKPSIIKNAYLGYDVNENEEQKFFKSKKIDKKKYRIIKKDLNKEAAKLLLNNKILARISGRGEFGARALGNRSILANPSVFENKAKINNSIKSRDFWMPFAATVLSDHADKYFYFMQNKVFYKYMTNCVRTKSFGVLKLAAAVHPQDKTCRPQILKKDDNKEYYNLIKEFGNISGIFGLLNTSFNIHGMPIVNDCHDAFSVLENTNLDGLIMSKTLIVKNASYRRK